MDREDFEEYDLLIRNGTLYDGSGSPAYVGDVAVKGDKIARVGEIGKAPAKQVVDASGLAVAPGFINIMSYASIPLLVDGRSQSDIRQGVTLEVFGEGWSEGPLTEAMKQEVIARQVDFNYPVPWNSLGEFLSYLEGRGVSTNFGSFVGADTLWYYVMEYETRHPTPEEMEAMGLLLAQAMEEGALGLSTALIYTPGCRMRTEEIIQLAKVAARYDGVYISHLRSEGDGFLEALDELLRIAQEAHIRAEIYHLKVMGPANWDKMKPALDKIEQARAQGQQITADMYTYPAGMTGLDACIPPWVQEGPLRAWTQRLKEADIRQRVREEIGKPSKDWENHFLACGDGRNIRLVGFKSEALKPLTGKTLAEIARLRGKPEVDSLMDLLVEDGSRISTVYFDMSEENMREQLKRGWVCLGSDAGSLSSEGIFLKSSTHPRAYGTFARWLGRYTREEKLVPLEEAIRKITALPASTLRIKGRGRLQAGCYADITVFDPGKIQDRATFDEPHQYASGVVHVWVNGGQVLREGEHTGAMPGRAVRRGTAD